MVNWSVIWSDARTTTGQCDTLREAKQRIEQLTCDPFYTQGRHIVFIALHQRGNTTYDMLAGKVIEGPEHAEFHRVDQGFPQTWPTGYGPSWLT